MTLLALNRHVTFTPTMGRPKLEEAKITSVRLPVRIWNLLEQAAKDRGLTLGKLLWQLAEDFLVSAGYMKPGERKRPKVRGKPQ